MNATPRIYSSANEPGSPSCKRGEALCDWCTEDVPPLHIHIDIGPDEDGDEQIRGFCSEGCAMKYCAIFYPRLAMTEVTA